MPAVNQIRNDALHYYDQWSQVPPLTPLTHHKGRSSKCAGAHLEWKEHAGFLQTDLGGSL